MARREESTITYRHDIWPSDVECVRRIVASTGYFSPEEIEIAVELVEERLAKGVQSGYLFHFAEDAQRVVGYACFGPIPGTLSSYDIYWAAVDPKRQGQGIGKELLYICEMHIADVGGGKAFIDTSSRLQYAPTRRLFEKCGYRQVALLEDFYGPGDGKIIYVKDISAKEA